MKLRIVALLFLASTTGSLFAQVPKQPAIKPVAGESWLHHLHRSFGESSMGKTWLLGPTSDSDSPPLPVDHSSTTTPITLHGADLYRLNCQGCHGESGQGAPPEISSLIDPVRSTSVILVSARMKKIGMDISRHEAAEMARQSNDALLNRLHHGGHDMPSFQQLNDGEIRSLVAYLDLLAGVPGAEHFQSAVSETPVRVGELIVKSTCHTCHDAVGTNPTSADILEGEIPPLSALPARVDSQQLVRKVTVGATVADPTGSTHRGRMPVFSYLKASEAEDIYAYLQKYPPQRDLAPDSSNLQAASTANTGTPLYRPENLTAQPAFDPPPAPDPFSAVDSRALLMSSLSIAFILFSVGGFVTVHEFHRLALRAKQRIEEKLQMAETAHAVVLLECRTPGNSTDSKREWTRRKIS